MSYRAVLFAALMCLALLTAVPVCANETSTPERGATSAPLETIAPKGYAYVVYVKKTASSAWQRASTHRDSNDAEKKARYYQSLGWQTLIRLERV